MSIFAPILLHWKTLTTRRAVEAEIGKTIALSRSRLDRWCESLLAEARIKNSEAPSKEILKEAQPLTFVGRPLPSILTTKPESSGIEKIFAWLSIHWHRITRVLSKAGQVVRKETFPNEDDLLEKKEEELRHLTEVVDACQSLLDTTPDTEAQSLKRSILNEKLERCEASLKSGQARLSAIRVLSSQLQIATANARLEKSYSRRHGTREVLTRIEMRVQALESIVTEQIDAHSGHVVLAANFYSESEAKIAQNEMLAKQSAEQITALPMVAVDNLTTEDLTIALELCRKIIAELTDSYVHLFASIEQTKRSLQLANVQKDRWQARVSEALGLDERPLLADAQNHVLHYNKQTEDFEELLADAQTAMQPIANRMDRLEKVALLLQEQMDDCSKNDAE